MKSKTSRKGRKRKSSASALKSPPESLLQSKNDDDDNDTTFIKTTPSKQRVTRSQQVILPKNEPEESRKGYRNCPSCGVGVHAIWGCKTVIPKKIDTQGW